MGADEKHPAFSFHIDSGEIPPGPFVQTVPAAVLVQILQCAQQAFELIGLHVEGRSIIARARVPATTSQRFRLVCQVPQAGCYALPVTIGASGELFSAGEADRAFVIFRELMSRISRRSDDGLAATLPDERVRRKVLEAMRAMAPPAGAKWTFNLRDGQGQVFADIDQHTSAFVQSLLLPVVPREDSRVLTGELKRIDFKERTLTIIYLPTKRELICNYGESLEDLLYEKRRELIQVTGRVLLDEAGQPRQLIDVSDIRDVDLTPFELSSLEYGSIRLRAQPALKLDLVTDDSQQLLCVENEALGIHAFAATRDAFLIEVEEQVTMLWREFAMADDAELDRPALALKTTLRARFSEAVDAT